MLRPLIVLPTYNEAENIAEILKRVRAVAPQAGILVVDDSSPDGTADIAWAMAAEVGGLDLLSRPGKSGLGSAYRDGGDMDHIAFREKTWVRIDAAEHHAAAIADLVTRLAAP